MTWQLARHEWRRTRAGLLFWLLLTVGQLTIAWLVFAQLESYNRIAPQLNSAGSTLGATDLIIAPTFGSLVLLLLLAVPLLAQGGLAGEARSGRLTLWLSAPVTSTTVVVSRVVGVFLATLPLLLTTVLTLALTSLGIEFDWPRFLLGVTALLAYTLWLAAITVSISTWVEHPAAVLALSYGMLVFLWLLDSFVSTESALHWAALLPHLQPAFAGLLRSVDVAYLLVTGAAAIGIAIYRVAGWRDEL